ncbi:multiple cyclophane-containing RiPP AmcA [Streptosporangium amethystogenes subsp. fukuiense]|uniref:Multiple cyclophane-containing RiPP AmcA n=1 Tax=Streptosporangium amethystogenes subsp. fukuiense TaxID=698418 RepID=A0ABW2SRT4_9ACTN
MTMLEYLAATDAKVIDKLISGSPPENLDPVWAAKFDNKPSWDNQKGGFDNKPSWDNWSKKK